MLKRIASFALFFGSLTSSCKSTPYTESSAVKTTSGDRDYYCGSNYILTVKSDGHSYISTVGGSAFTYEYDSPSYNQLHFSGSAYGADFFRDKMTLEIWKYGGSTSTFDCRD